MSEEYEDEDDNKSADNVRKFYRRRRREFSADERERLLAMLENYERTRWFWSTVGLVAKWVTSVAAATVVILSILKWGVAEIIRWRP